MAFVDLLVYVVTMQAHLFADLLVIVTHVPLVLLTIFIFAPSMVVNDNIAWITSKALVDLVQVLVKEIHIKGGMPMVEIRTSS